MENVRIPEKWKEWTDLEKIGEGSYGTVYKASRTIGGEMVFCAIKVIRVPKEAQEMQEMLQLLGKEDALKEYYRDLVEDYIREIQAMERLKGITNIVSIQDYAMEPNDDGYGWTIFIQMEYLTPFQTYMMSHPIDEAEVIRLGTDLCNALIYCEKAGIIHKDLKVENIFVSDMGNYELGDFGVARKMDRTTSAYSNRGTFSYMAPEVFKGEPYDHRVDIYSLGLVMYRLLNNNREPFLPADKQMVFFRDREEALVKRMGGDPIPLPAEASRELSDIILKSLSYEKEDRYSSALEMKTALQAIAEKSESGEKADVSHRKVRKRTIILIIVAMIMGGCLFLLTRKKQLTLRGNPLVFETAEETEYQELIELIPIDLAPYVGFNVSEDHTDAWILVKRKKLEQALINAGVNDEETISMLSQNLRDQFSVKAIPGSEGTEDYSIRFDPNSEYKDLQEKANVSFTFSQK